MALCKEIIKPNGVKTSYHKISYISTKYAEQNEVVAMMTSYLDKEHRNNGAQIEDNAYSFTLEANIEPTREIIYGEFKKLPEWEDAEDC